MLNSIQHFTENGIPQLEEIMKKFMQNPADLNQFVDQVKEFRKRWKNVIRRWKKV